MSISYVAVATDDRAKIRPLLEERLQEGVPPLDVSALYRLLTTRTRVRGPENATLRWEDGDGGYVFVDLRKTHVEITQGTGGGDGSDNVVMILIDALNDAGLSVLDPQRGSWFPGSPVKAKAQPAAKTEPKATPKRPATKAPAKTKPAAKTKPTKR